MNCLDKIMNTIFNSTNVVSTPTKSDNCPICLDPIKDNNSCILKCEHKFHLECIFELYRTKNAFSNKCPMCRDEFTKKDAIQVHHHFVIHTPQSVRIQTPQNVQNLNAPRNNNNQTPMQYLFERLNEMAEDSSQEMSVRSI